MGLILPDATRLPGRTRELPASPGRAVSPGL